MCAERVFWAALGKSWFRGERFFEKKNEKRGGFCDEW